MRHIHACFVPLTLLLASTSVARADESNDGNTAPTPSESAPVPPAVAEREKAVAERETAVAEREKAVAEREKAVGERERAVAEPKKPAIAEPDRKVSVGADVAVLVPVGELADDTGVAVGPLLRLGYLVGGGAELTLRSGYLHSFEKTNAAFSTRTSNVPIWFGARYFFMEPHAGLYGSFEMGPNFLLEKRTGSSSSFIDGGRDVAVTQKDTEPRFGLNLAVGFVVSKAVPIDIRAQYSYLNVLGGDDGEDPLMGVGASVGYTFHL
jgi:hypothetical protein